MNDNFLSPQGRERRSQILKLAVAESRRHRRRRWIAPGSVTAILIVGSAMVALLPRHPKVVPINQPSPIAEITPPPASQPSLAIQYLATDSTITDRLSVTPHPPRWTSINDHELLDELAAAGQPAGLAYVNGRAILLSSSSTPAR